MKLNARCLRYLESVLKSSANLFIARAENQELATVLDFGVDVVGGIQAGIALSRICASDLLDVSVVDNNDPGALAGLPRVQVRTDSPLLACMGSQYGGWPVATDTFFAIGSGPMRASRGKEPVLEQYAMFQREKQVIGVLESDELPDLDTIKYVASECEVSPDHVTLCVAPTRSTAGALQIVARSVEATMHKLFELEIDLRAVRHGFGSAILPPPSPKQMIALGRTNDSILYGGRVTLWMDLDDDVIQSFGGQLPSNSSSEFGRPFAEMFERADGDFYKMDPMVFSAAQISICSIPSGNVHRFGELRLDIVEKSFCV